MTPDELRTQFRQQAQAAQSLNIAYVGVVNNLFSSLRVLETATAPGLAAAAGMDAGYMNRWCDAAFAFGYLDADGDRFRLTETGAAMCPDSTVGLMPIAVQSVLSAHMSERAAALMRTGERPGEQVLAERETILPWFGPMLEAMFGPLFERRIAGAIEAFAEVDGRAGLAVDLGCGNGWYLRVLARRFARLRGLGVDGFAENIDQATRLAQAGGLQERLSFLRGDIHELTLAEPADLIAMNRALHHVWEKDTSMLFAWLQANLKPGGYAVVWEPAWPDDRTVLREPGRRTTAFQNLSEHVQGNHFLRPQEIVQAFQNAGMTAQIHLFAEGAEAVIVARK